MTICILVRHGETTFNVEGRINGDPAILVPLSARGREEAAQLARHIAHVRIEICVHTRFPRTLETAQIGLGARGQIPLVCEALLDDINAGDLEGRPMTELGAWVRVTAQTTRSPAARACTTQRAGSPGACAAWQPVANVSCSPYVTNYRSASRSTLRRDPRPSTNLSTRSRTPPPTCSSRPRWSSPQRESNGWSAPGPPLHECVRSFELFWSRPGRYCASPSRHSSWVRHAHRWCDPAHRRPPPLCFLSRLKAGLEAPRRLRLPLTS